MEGKRRAVGRSDGFYKEIEQFVEEEERVLEVRGEEIEEGVYKVERVVERRKRRVSIIFFLRRLFCKYFLGKSGVFDTLGWV